MGDISLEAVTGKLNRIGYEAFIQALRQAKGSGNRNVELAHWIFQILQRDTTDIARTADFFDLDRAKLLADVGGVVEGFRRNETDRRRPPRPRLALRDALLRRDPDQDRSCSGRGHEDS